MQKNLYQTASQAFHRFKGLSSLMPALVMAFAFFAEPAFAGSGGLNVATQKMEEIKTWAYGILGVGVFLYMIYLVIMALLNKGTWADVGMGLVYSAAAGGIVVAATWAWGIWGS